MTLRRRHALLRENWLRERLCLSLFTGGDFIYYHYDVWAGARRRSLSASSPGAPRTRIFIYSYARRFSR